MGSDQCTARECRLLLKGLGNNLDLTYKSQFVNLVQLFFGGERIDKRVILVTYESIFEFFLLCLTLQSHFLFSPLRRMMPIIPRNHCEAQMMYMETLCKLSFKPLLHGC